MGIFDDIQSRVDARMSEIAARVGAGRPEATVPTRFDVTEVIRSVRGMGSARSGCRKLALCVGLPQVDPAAYDGSRQPCPGCDLDARDFADVLKAADFGTTLKLNGEATRAGVLAAMRQASESLAPGDLFVMLVAGHGARDRVADGAGGSSVHESWCLWDGKLLDDEIVAAVNRFAAGVRIVMVNDQCHSGGIFTETARGGFWRTLAVRRSVAPMLIQFAACRAEESSIGYPIGGTWTIALLKALAVDRNVSWRGWFDRAQAHPSLTECQRPQWEEAGPVSDSFRNGVVFQ